MGDVDEIPPPPEGFVLAEGRGGFSSHIGPYFTRPDGAQAFFALKRHCNGLGVLHGGMLSAFLDGVLGRAAGSRTGRTSVTLHLSVDYLAMGRAGHWVLGEGRLTKAAGDVAFVEGRAYMAGRDLARATGVFKLMRRRAH